MNLSDLLNGKGIDPRQVIVMRHRPFEPELNRVLPWLAADKPDVFNAYQQKLEKVMSALQGAGFVASFIRHEPGKALFVGLYRIGDSRPLTLSQYWAVPANVEMKAFGMRGFSTERRSSVLWFDLALHDFYAHWKGRLIIGWPPPERSWWRRAHRNDFPVLAILEDSALVARMPEWNEMALSWEELSVMPARWKAALEQWRGIYYIFDVSDGKGYVGSAYGAENLLGRWLNYAATGHGGNGYCASATPGIFASRFCNDSRQTWMRAMPFVWRVRGRIASTLARLSASTTIETRTKETRTKECGAACASRPEPAILGL